MTIDRCLAASNQCSYYIPMMSPPGSQQSHSSRALDSRDRSRTRPSASYLEKDSVRFSFSLAFCCSRFTKHRTSIQCLMFLLKEMKSRRKPAKQLSTGLENPAAPLVEGKCTSMCCNILPNICIYQQEWIN